jgi:hypothetical protein
MLTPLLILSKSDDGDLIKIVVGVVFAALWGLGALISSWNKKVEEQRKRRQSGTLPRDVRQPTAYQPQYPYPAPPPVPPAPARQRKRRRPAVAPAPPPPPEQAPEKPVPVSATASPTRAQAPQQRHELSESGRIARLLLKKDSLRAALILQEVLSPPVSLRDR